MEAGGAIARGIYAKAMTAGKGAEAAGGAEGKRGSGDIGNGLIFLFDFQYIIKVQLGIQTAVLLMATIPKIVPISDLRLKVTSIVKDLAGSREPVYITQRGRASAALISLEAFQQAQQERDLLRFLAQGEKEMEAGKGSDLKEVVKEADRLLERMKA